MKVVLAEKKIQAEELAKPFPHKKAHGYIELLPSDTFPKGGFLVWASGHLISLAEPDEYDPKYKKWDIQDLPIVPSTFKYKIDRAKSGLYSIIKKFVNDSKVTEVIIATDPGREGELIARLILRQVGNKKPIKRLWTSSLTKSAVEQAFQNLLPEAAKRNLYYEAYSRQCADWLVGMNTSRLYTLMLQKKGAKEDGIFSTGRVQTPLLELIVERELGIEKFVSKPFWQVFAEFEVNGKKYRGQWYKDSLTNLPVQKLSLDLKHACEGKPAVIRDVKEDQKQFKPPLLHNLSSLQTLANKKYRYSTQEVLDIVQGLYERGIVSYPRSDSQYITENEAAIFPLILNKLKNVHEFSDLLPAPISTLIGNRRYVNPEKVSDHYAIIPTENVPQLSDLDDRERHIYGLIARSLIAAHYENAIFDYKEIITYVDAKFSFISKGKIIVQEGWRKVLYPGGQIEEKETIDADEQNLPPLVIGEQGIAAEVISKEGKTQPPKRYTEGDLITLMKNAGKSLENQELEKILQGIDGLGTEATRSGMIGKLKQQKYIEIKRNLVYSTSKGRILIQAIGKSILASAEMTGQWEKKLREIGQGKVNYNQFIEEVKALTLNLVQEGYVSVQRMSSSVASPSASIAETLSVSNSRNSLRREGPQTTTDSTKEDLSQPSTEIAGLQSKVSASVIGTQHLHHTYALAQSTNNELINLGDELYFKAVSEVVQSRQASVSFLQRRLALGYTECAGLIDRMEQDGVIGPYLGYSPRKVLIDLIELQKRFPRVSAYSVQQQVQQNSSYTVRSEETKLSPEVNTQATSLIEEVYNQPISSSDHTTPEMQQLAQDENKPTVLKSNKEGVGYTASQTRPVNYTKTSGEASKQNNRSWMQSRKAMNMHDLGYCPKCQAALVVDKGRFYGCSGYKSTGCDFTISKVILGVEITKDDVQQLLNKGETPVKKGFKRKNANDYFDAAIVMKDNAGIEFKSPEPRVLQLPTSLLRFQEQHKSEENNRQEIEWIETATAMIKMPAKVKKVSHGPKVVRYEMLPETLKINISNYRRYKDNFQAALQAERITLYSPIPGSNHVGIEVPNKNPYIVNLRGMLDNRDFLVKRSALLFPIGVDMVGNPIFADLAKMPHLLIAGETGAGKSVFLNALIISLLYGLKPSELRFVMIDPKKVELSVYSKLPHLFCPIIIDPQRAIMALKSLTNEMDKRYDLFAELGVRNIQSYNEQITQKNPKASKLPYIVLIIDELADLMMTAAADVEIQIQRLSQLARAAGIHMVIATQRPTKQFLSPNIKANLPVRLAFAVAATNDSMVILDESGAEDLLGKGDMIFKPKDGPRQRLVSAYVSDEEIENVVNYISQTNPYREDK
ncbi:DNA topoisomerase 3 [Paenibacillus polymyxa]|uniref:DNA topoisomerase 3 n=1 Tax=Paenibacillus polymyxa TaxID=1406 RepID=UPI0025B6BF8A|nr:DNA topoisomerase 3 [Paenibacillus polymyxa]MDN4106461.1 DNA topoisomerase 3 [Paenibacillus polymyxa]